MTKLHLPNVTLVAVDTAAHELTDVVLADCMAKADFGAVLVLSDKPPGITPCTYVQIDPCGSVQAQAHYWYTVPRHIGTSHMLIVQWDSGISDPAQWTDEFLDYDYVGAPWGWHRTGLNVGNGGFSLRSIKLANYLADNPSTLPFAAPEDHQLCRTHGYMLQIAGFKFAPLPLASQFSIERTVLKDGPRQHLGFHGMFNWSEYLQVPEPETVGDEIERRLAVAPEWVRQSPHHTEMMERWRRRQAGEPPAVMDFDQKMVRVMGGTR